jgi:hypothetical protein
MKHYYPPQDYMTVDPSLDIQNLKTYMTVHSLSHCYNYHMR